MMPTVNSTAGDQANTGTEKPATAEDTTALINKAWGYLRVAERYLERWGTVSASVSASVTDLSEIQFKLDKRAEDFFGDDGRYQQSRRSDSQRDSTISLNAGATDGSAEPPPEGGLATPPGDTSTVVISMRDRLKQAFDDYMTLKMLESIVPASNVNRTPNSPADPGSQQTPDFVLLGAGVTVSIRPGAVTSSGHLAEIDIFNRYSRLDGDRSKPLGSHPRVVAALPFMDTEFVQDEQDAQSRSSTTADVGGGILQRFGLNAVRAQIRGAQRRTAKRASVLPRIVGYNVAGRHVGWRFVPRTGTKPSLHATSFPALLIMAIKREDFVEQETSATEGTRTDDAECPTHLSIRAVWHWMADRESPVTDWWRAELSRRFPRLANHCHRDPNVALKDAMAALSLARRTLKDLGHRRHRQTLDRDHSYTFDLLKARLNSLEGAICGVEVLAPIPRSALEKLGVIPTTDGRPSEAAGGGSPAAAPGTPD